MNEKIFNKLSGEKASPVEDPPPSIADDNREWQGPAALSEEEGKHFNAPYTSRTELTAAFIDNMIEADHEAGQLKRHRMLIIVAAAIWVMVISVVLWLIFTGGQKEQQKTGTMDQKRDE
ncbi:MAG TPA: hypothetical protein VM802_02645 [Chitinophaga sp.]|uniref:hypothetical protein n=1 Tax=Chitinophaga sp. TaxID=1869181 RepID=UPI002BB69C2E|nr:hypothetical protein [Chitinophaga sp.]HVI43735.1 hypothetical protein [Chitinophaga sp.]